MSWNRSTPGNRTEKLVVSAIEKAALFKISRLKLRSTEIYIFSFGSAIRGVSEPLNSFQLILPLEGQIVTRHSNQNLEVQPGFAAIQFLDIVQIIAGTTKAKRLSSESALPV